MRNVVKEALTDLLSRKSDFTGTTSRETAKTAGDEAHDWGKK